MNLSSEQAAELRTLAADRHVTADVALRARIVLWAGEGRRRKDIAELAGVSARTVDRTRTRSRRAGWRAWWKGSAVAERSRCRRRPAAG